MTIKTLTLSPTEIEILAHQMKAYPMRTIDYAHFQAKLDKGTITAYLSGKVVFAGADALLYAQQFETKSASQAGSDEVGTGDYFGPITVWACYVDETQMDYINTLNVFDSKQTSDSKVRELAPILMDTLTYSLLVLDNVTYNKVHPTKNMNAIKAELHQKAFSHLKNKLNGVLPELSIVDQFTPKANYYRYLQDDYGITNLKFETKAESKYISVACASIIGRYAFLRALDQYSEYYKMDFPKGASAKVDQFGVQFVTKYTFNELNKVAKVHFVNTKRIEELLQGI